MSSQPHPQNLADRENVLVAAAAQIHDDDLLLAHFRRALDDFGQRMAGLQRRDDAFKPGQQLERLERLRVHDRHIFAAAGVFEP